MDVEASAFDYLVNSRSCDVIFQFCRQLISFSAWMQIATSLFFNTHYRL